MALEVTTDAGVDATPRVSRETANLNMDSKNFGVRPLVKKFSERKFDPKQEFLTRARES